MAVDRNGREIAPDRMKARRRIAKGIQAPYLFPGTLAALAQVQDDASELTHIADIVNELLAADSDATTRARALGDLLAAYGVGTIVAGPIG